MMSATTLVLVAGFSLPLWQLVKFALASELYSHILLIPAVSWYLLRLQRERGRGDSPPVRWLALVLGLTGALVLAGYWHADRVALTEDDRLVFTTGAFVLFVWSVCCFSLIRKNSGRRFFPWAFSSS